MNYMSREEEMTDFVRSYNGEKGLIPCMYFWVTEQEQLVAVGLPWGDIPKGLHGHLLKMSWAELGPPKAIYLIVEARCAPFDSEDNETRERLQKWRAEHGSLEGFDGIIDQAVLIGYDGSRFTTKMWNLDIEKDETRIFKSEEPNINPSSMGGVFADNMITAFHNVMASPESPAEH